MKKALLSIMCGVIFLSAAPVFSGGQGEGSAEGPANLRVMWWGSQQRHDVTIGAIEYFEEQNENIEIEYEFAGWEDYWTRLNTMAAGRDLPDIMQQDYAYLSEWSSRDQLLPLDEFVESGVLDFSNVDDSLLEGGRVDGELYGINLGINAESIVMDREMFEEAGVDIPAWDWTWGDFEETVLALSEGLGDEVWGIGGGLYNEQIWQSIYLSLGADTYNDDGTGIGYDDDQPFIDHFEMLLRLQDENAIPDISEHLASYYEQGVEAQPIVDGRAAMDYLWSNQIIAQWRAAGEDRDMVIRPIPRVEGGEPGVYVKPSQFFSVTAGTEYPEAAARFLDAVTNDIELNRILLAERGVPINADVRDDIGERVSDIESAVFDYMAEVPNWASPVPPPEPEGHGDIINNVYNPEVAEGILFGEITPEEGAETLRNEVNRILGD